MNSSMNGDYEEALRRALHAAADSIEPSAEGLQRIRERINRPMLSFESASAWYAGLRRWLEPVAAAFRAVVDRFRPAAARPGHAARPRYGWVRPVAAMGAAVFVVAVGGFALTHHFSSTSASTASSDGGVHSGDPAPHAGIGSGGGHGGTPTGSGSHAGSSGSGGNPGGGATLTPATCSSAPAPKPSSSSSATATSTASAPASSTPVSSSPPVTSPSPSPDPSPSADPSPTGIPAPGVSESAGPVGSVKPASGCGSAGTTAKTQITTPPSTVSSTPPPSTSSSPAVGTSAKAPADGTTSTTPASGASA